jgi:hypothetical protein
MVPDMQNLDRFGYWERSSARARFSVTLSKPPDEITGKP